MVLILHMYEALVLIIYICEVLVPILHSCEEFIPVFYIKEKIVPVYIPTVLKKNTVMIRAHYSHVKNMKTDHKFYIKILVHKSYLKHAYAAIQLGLF